MIGFNRALLKARSRHLPRSSPNRPERRALPAIPTSRSASSSASRPAAATTCSRGWSGRSCRRIIGQPVIIENKPGAGGRLAVEYVKNQPADGYTIMVAASGQMAIAAAIYPKLPYHPTRDFMPAHHDRVVSADPRRPRQRHASRRSRTWSPTARPIPTSRTTRPPRRPSPSPPSCSSSRPACRRVAIPYKSSNEMMLSVAGGNTLFSIADGPPTVPLVKGGKVRALAVTGSERSSELPDVPSMAEAGYPEVNIGLWSGVFALGQHAARDRQEARGGAAARARRPRRAREAQGHGGQSRRRPGRGIPQADRRRHQGLCRRRQGRESEVRGLSQRLSRRSWDRVHPTEVERRGLEKCLPARTCPC